MTRKVWPKAPDLSKSRAVSKDDIGWHLPPNPDTPTTRPDPHQRYLSKDLAKSSVGKLSRWEDYSPEDRKQVEAHLKDKFGITRQNAMNSLNGHLTAAFSQRAPGEQHAKGQGWYQGGEGTQADEMRKLGEKHGVPFHVVAATRGAVSPNVPVSAERRRAEFAVSTRIKPSEVGPQTVPEGARGLWGNLAKGVQIVKENREQGIRPEDVKDERGVPVLNGFKVKGYMNSYTHPENPFTRPAIDRHAIRAAAPHLTMAQTREIQGHHLSVKPGVGEFFADVYEKTAHKHGLSPAEAQSVIWHQVNGGRSVSNENPRNVAHRARVEVQRESRRPVPTEKLGDQFHQTKLVED